MDSGVREGKRLASEDKSVEEKRERYRQKGKEKVEVDRVSPFKGDRVLFALHSGMTQGQCTLSGSQGEGPGVPGCLQCSSRQKA